ncbi:gliding motility protein GldM [Hugenholtzia roseola]|uniref:type IX secretion system motor protein PorM/GldM n=1 Tax=Hugenholtzia roseola TaxID=1002 RepID=UPI0006884C87|nr:gliding motility protein GldM [Hugenholtzia roseola]
MAGGGKETPRQRMVGMMYLVLTALLALQVQNTVLEKFYFIDASLREARDVARRTNGLTVKSMNEVVNSENGNPKDMIWVKKAQEVQAATSEMLAEFATIRETLIKESGGRLEDDTTQYADAKGYDNVNRIMLGEGDGGTGIAYGLDAKMNAFGEKVAKIDTTVANAIKHNLPLAKKKEEDPMFATNPKYDGMDWQRINFQNTPLVASLAVLSQMENQVAKVETDAIKALQNKIGGFVLKFDQVGAKVTAESKYVAAGTKYKAELFVSASSTTAKPTMSSSVGGVSVDQATGIGKIEFTASAGDYNKEGVSEKSWRGSITIKNAAGIDTTLTVDEKYFVVKPVIDVQSASVQALYLKCGNELNIQVPALGALYDPSFTASGGSVIKGASKGMVTIVPDGKEVTIGVSSGGNKIGDKKFNVRLVPKPAIEVVKLNMKTGGPPPQTIAVKAVADQSFAQFLPKDARYRVAEFTVTLARGKRPVGAPITVRGDSGSVAALAASAKDGDRMIIEVKSVQRMNFQNQVENVGGIGDVIFTYPISM